jgi:hypothetical protein
MLQAARMPGDKTSAGRVGVRPHREAPAIKPATMPLEMP